MTLMHLGSQPSFRGWIPNMHGQHPSTAEGLYIIFGCVLQALLAEHAHSSATPPKWPTETALAIAVGHCNSVAQTLTLKQMH